MATQIAATPVIKGSEVIKILKEANRKPSKESEKGAKKNYKSFKTLIYHKPNEVMRFPRILT